MRVLLVYPNDRMDGLISVGISALSAHLKKANHEVDLYDTTFFDTGKKTGDFYREQMGQVIPVDLAQYGIVREKKNLNELIPDSDKYPSAFSHLIPPVQNITTSSSKSFSSSAFSFKAFV